MLNLETGSVEFELEPELAGGRTSTLSIFVAEDGRSIEVRSLCNSLIIMPKASNSAVISTKY